MKKTFPMICSGLYLVLALSAFISVFRAPPDGLANLPLAIVTLPLIVLERTLTYKIYGSMDGYLWAPLVKNLGLPSSYYLNHVYWFLPLIIIQAYLIFLIGNWIKKKMRS
jgi:hypothetical protein